MFFLIFAVSFFATILSSMSGAGSSMITIPAWILMGYPLPVAICTGNVNGALWTPVAAYNYLGKVKTERGLASSLIIFGLVGAYFGATVVANADAGLLQQVFGGIILFLVILVQQKKEFGIAVVQPRVNSLLTGLMAMPLGFYETFFGSGNGIFTSYMLIKARGLNLPTALGYYYLISFTWCCYGAYLLLLNGYGSLELILPSSLGGILGAHFGSKIGHKRGTGFIRQIFIVLGAFLGMKLLLGY
jgi:uncharacterized membrane protein YfcA